MTPELAREIAKYLKELVELDTVESGTGRGYLLAASGCLPKLASTAQAVSVWLKKHARTVEYLLSAEPMCECDPDTGSAP